MIPHIVIFSTRKITFICCVFNVHFVHFEFTCLYPLFGSLLLKEGLSLHLAYTMIFFFLMLRRFVQCCLHLMAYLPSDYIAKTKNISHWLLFSLNTFKLSCLIFDNFFSIKSKIMKFVCLFLLKKNIKTCNVFFSVPKLNYNHFKIVYLKKEYWCSNTICVKILYCTENWNHKMNHGSWNSHYFDTPSFC